MNNHILQVAEESAKACATLEHAKSVVRSNIPGERQRELLCELLGHLYMLGFSHGARHTAQQVVDRIDREQAQGARNG